MSKRTSDGPPVFTGEPSPQAPPALPVFGDYRATLELITHSGARVSARVSVEGSALVVEQVLAAAAGAFREDAER